MVGDRDAQFVADVEVPLINRYADGIDDPVGAFETGGDAGGASDCARPGSVVELLPGGLQLVGIAQHDRVNEGRDLAARRNEWVEHGVGDGYDVDRAVLVFGALTEHPRVAEQSKEALIEPRCSGRHEFHLRPGEFTARFDVVLVNHVVGQVKRLVERVLVRLLVR